MAPSPPITVVLIDANPLARAGCKGVLEQDPELQVLADVAAPAELDPGMKPDLLIIDPVIDGRFDHRAAMTAMEMYADAGVLLLTEVCKGDFYFPHGYARGVSMLSKACSPETLRHAAHIVAEKKVRVTDRRLFDGMLEEGRAVAEERRRAGQIKLTPREQEILQVIADGLTHDQVARHLVISKSAVQTHVSNMVRKAPVATRDQFMLYALATGLVEYKLPVSQELAD